MNGSIIHHHENSNDKINAGIRVRESIPNIALHVSVTPYLPKLPDIYTG